MFNTIRSGMKSVFKKKNFLFMTSNTNKNLPTDKQKKNKPDITNNFFLTIMLSSTFLTGYYIFSKTLVSSNIETVSISELNKKYNYDKISVIDNSVVIAKKMMKTDIINQIFLVGNILKKISIQINLSILKKA